MADSPGTLEVVDKEYMRPEVSMVNKIMEETVENTMSDAELSGKGAHQLLENYKYEKGKIVKIVSLSTTYTMAETRL